MTTRSGSSQRTRELAAIHCAKRDMGMDEGAYRAMLYAVARVRSARDLDDAGRRRVLDHLRTRGWRRQPPRRHHVGAPHNIDRGERSPQLRKIEALLADAGRPWGYAEGIARRMFRASRIAFCDPGQLRSIIAALEYDARRRRAREAQETVGR